MKISISAYNQWLSCPHAAWWQHNQRTWAPPGRALTLGTALHKYMEALLLEQPAPEMPLLDPEDVRYYEQFVAAVPKDFMAQEGLKVWQDSKGEPAVEIALSYEVSGGVQLVGRLDAIVEDMDGRLWSLQWKTVGKGKPIGGELAKILHSHHEMTYQWLAVQSGITLAGTLLGTFRKLSKKDAEAGVPVFALHRLERDYADVVKFMARDLFPQLSRMHSDMYYSGPAPRNWLSCFGFYGNSRCPLFDMCHLGIPGDCLPLVPMEERYDDLESRDSA